MKKIGKILILLFIVTMIFQIFYVWLNQKYEMKYQIKEKDKTFVIEETYTGKLKEEEIHYDWMVNGKFSFSYFGYLGKSSKLIKAIAYFEGKNYQCIYPTFKSKKIKMDVICLDGTKQVYYHTISGKDKKLDSFVSSLSSYDTSLFIDDTKTVETKGFIKVYKNNILENQYIGFQNYKGFYQIKSGDNLVEDISLYKNDVYEPILTASAGKYFLSADYTDKYRISSFYLVNIETGDKKQVHTSYDISYDSYIEGTYQDSIYLFDPKSKKQYKMDVKKKKLTMTSAGAQIYYYDGKKLQKEDNKKAITGKRYFVSALSVNQKGDTVVEKTGTKRSGYYYYYKKTNKGTEVSRAPISNPDKITYLFQTEEIRNIIYKRNYVYFLSGDTLKYYSDETGLRTLATHEEICFNQALNYFVYIK